MQFERVFREYGLPLVIRSDNGSPFSSRGICGLSKLSAWWIKLGIHPERIEPASPDQNGRHERMHRTLKQHTALPPAQDLQRQQELFDAFMDEYNNERPHEALEMTVPSSIYVASERVFPSRPPCVNYVCGMNVRKVKLHGDIIHYGKRLFVSESLSGEYIGIEQISEDASKLWYCNYELGRLDHRKWKLEPATPHPLSAGVNSCTDDHKLTNVLPMSSV